MNNYPPMDSDIAPPAVDPAVEKAKQDDIAREIVKRITFKLQEEQEAYDRMDADLALWNLDPWHPDADDSIAPEDTYTTNAPRVLAQKIIAYLAGTELIVRISNDDAPKPQEALNDSAEQLAIGLVHAAERRLTRKGSPGIKESVAFYVTVRGRYAAMRALLRKGPEGTFVDMLPLDPRHLFIEWGDDEPVWAAYRMTRTKAQLHAEYPDFEYDAQASNANVPENVYEYYAKVPNPTFMQSPSPFDMRPYIYVAGTICRDRFLKPLHDVYTMHFPIVAVPVDAQPMLTPSEKGERTTKHFGESIFAENRKLWETLNRVTSYTIDMTAKASDPRQKVMSSDGTLALDEGSTEKGAQVQLSAANQEDVEPFKEADINNAVTVMLQILQNDAVAGGLPPQAFGLLDKPLSAVALRQLGSNLEHRILPRMKALSLCVEMCLQNILDQYETGGFDPIPVSGRRLDSTRFAGKVIQPEEITGHDPVEVTMQLALPEDTATIWSIAQQAMSPTAAGQPLASLEWTREHILHMPSHKVIDRQNLETLAKAQDEVAAALTLYKAALVEQDTVLAAILYDKLQVLAFKRQVEGEMMLQQLAKMAAGIMPGAPPPGKGTPPGEQAKQGGQSRNPANGAPGVAQQRGEGNQPSPEAGWNTTAERPGAQNSMIGA